jgi:hypothetical protein
MLISEVIAPDFRARIPPEFCYNAIGHAQYKHIKATILKYRLRKEG